MTFRDRLKGLATPKATAERLERCAPGPGWIRELGDTGVSVSALGFGAYRVSEGDAEHEAALRAALTDGGVNLVDTSWNYEQGASEQLIGRVLGELIAEGQLVREEVVVVWPDEAPVHQHQHQHQAVVVVCPTAPPKPACVA